MAKLFVTIIALAFVAATLPAFAQTTPKAKKVLRSC